MGERAGNAPPSNSTAMKDNGPPADMDKSPNTNMNTTLPHDARPVKLAPPVPLPHTTSTESAASTSTTSTAIFSPKLPPRPSSSSSKSKSRPSTPPLHRPSLKDRQPTTQVSTLDIQTLTFPDGTRGTFTSEDNTSSPSKGASLLNYISRKTSRGSAPNDVQQEVDDKTSIQSITPSSIHTRRLPAGVMSPGSIFSGFGGGSGPNPLTAAQRLLALQSAPNLPPFLDSIPESLRYFHTELDNLPDIQHTMASSESNEEVVLAQFRAKQKQYFILSSSGKPIWSRHGDINLINGYIGVISTIISSFASFSPPSPLHSFTAGSTLFVITKPGRGPLYFVGISKITGESIPQISKQLDSLYQQILSTLTLPKLTQLFTHRPGTDLSRSLEGTEKLLSSLCDSFTAGSPSSLLSALECLRMRKTHRQIISNTLLQHRDEKLLYGLVVAGGKLVSVLRPKRHSLHPGDLELIFNMLFPNGKKAGLEGETWVPVCLPGFNDGGYLYLYVSFLPLSEANLHRRGGSTASTPRREHKSSESFNSRLSTNTASPTKSSFAEAPPTPQLQSSHLPKDEAAEDEIAILLISPDREAFFALKSMRDAVVISLAKNGSLSHISRAMKLGRPSIPQILLPHLTARDRRELKANGLQGMGVGMRHFMYKSRADVQFVESKVDFGTPSCEDGEEDDVTAEARQMVRHRRLLSIYAALHAALHSRHTHPRIVYKVQGGYIALAWLTPGIEFYCVAGRQGRGGLGDDGQGADGEKEEAEREKKMLVKEAERVVRWVEGQRERVFILGGAVF